MLRADPLIQREKPKSIHQMFAWVHPKEVMWLVSTLSSDRVLHPTMSYKSNQAMTTPLTYKSKHIANVNQTKTRKMIAINHWKIKHLVIGTLWSLTIQVTAEPKKVLVMSSFSSTSQIKICLPHFYWFFKVLYFPKMRSSWKTKTKSYWD